jgi:Flp pilus assembly protein TadG
MARGRRDRGSVSVWLVIFAIISVFLVILLVDGGQAMLDKIRVADIAEQAARAAADDVNTTDLRGEGTVALASTACLNNANGPAWLIVSSYGTNSGLTTTMTGCAATQPPAGLPEQVSVTVTARVSPLITGVFGSYTVTSTQSATVFCGNFNAQVNC